MIYEFFTDKNLGILTNSVSDFAKMPNLKLIDYQILEYHTLDIYEKSVKRFTFGFQGNTFSLYLSKSDTIGFDFDGNKMHYTGEFHGFRLSNSGNSTNNHKIDKIKKYLISIVRDFKLNQIT